MDLRDILPPGYTLFLPSPEYFDGTTWRSTDGKRAVVGSATLADGVIRMDGVKDCLRDDRIASTELYRNPTPKAVGEAQQIAEAMSGSCGQGEEE